MPSSTTISTAIATAALCLVGVTVAGPLDPPAGPVTQTDPDLGQILNAVTASAPGCQSVPTTPGSPCSAQLTIPGLGAYDLFEFELGSLLSEPTGGTTMSPRAEAKQITAVRTCDGNSPFIFQAHATRSVYGRVFIQKGDLLLTLTNATIDGICNEMVYTCDGPVCAERLVLSAEGLTYTVGGNSFGWDYSTNSALP